MKSLFGIVESYRGDLDRLPMTILLFATVTLVVYLLFHSRKWIKYLPALVGIALGIGYLIAGFGQKASIEGLDQMWIGICFFVAGCIALATAWLCALMQSFSVRKQSTSQAPHKGTATQAEKRAENSHSLPKTGTRS